jgi:hypothetical protein
VKKACEVDQAVGFDEHVEQIEHAVMIANLVLDETDCRHTDVKRRAREYVPVDRAGSGHQQSECAPGLR